MDDEPEVGLVEAHAEGGGSDQRLHLVVLQRLLGGQPLRGVGAARVGEHRVSGLAEQLGGVLGRRHRQAVDDAAAGQVGQMLRQPRQPPPRGAQLQHPEPQRLTRQRAAQREHLVPAGSHLLGDVGDDPLVRRRGGGQHGHVRGQLGDQGADAAVVGPEVVAPVGDAVRLVDDDQPRRRHEAGQLLGPEAWVDEAFGGDEQHVERVVVEEPFDVCPLGDIRGVDRRGPDPGPLGGSHLVAHQREKRRDDESGPGPGPALQQGRDEVDGGLAPAGALHD